MIDAMVLRDFAARTQETYLSAVGQMARHHKLSPDLLQERLRSGCYLRPGRPEAADLSA